MELKRAVLQVSSCLLKSVFAAVLMGAAGSAGAFTGPTSPYYLDNYNTSQIFVVQGTSVTNSFPLSAYSGNGSDQQGSLAVGATVNTHGFTTFGDGGLLAGQYTLSGTPTGVSYDSFPLTPGYAAEVAYDGTTDGTHNYYVQYSGIPSTGGQTENVIQTDLNWQNPVVLFSVQRQPALGGEFLGISYDAANSSLWVSGYGLALIADYSLSGTLLYEFNPGQGGNDALGYDPADGTLWISSSQSSLLRQYSTSGVLLQFGVPIGLPDGSYHAGEFAHTAAVTVPEPASLALLGVGLAGLGLGFSRRRNWRGNGLTRRKGIRSTSRWVLGIAGVAVQLSFANVAQATIIGVDLEAGNGSPINWTSYTLADVNSTKTNLIAEDGSTTGVGFTLTGVTGQQNIPLGSPTYVPSHFNPLDTVCCDIRVALVASGLKAGNSQNES